MCPPDIEKDFNDGSEALGWDTPAYESYKKHETPKESETKLEITTLGEILRAPPVSWLIENVLFDRTLSVLGGYTGTGKSLLALTIAHAVSSGRSLFGKYKVIRPGPVLIVDEENSESDLRDRITALRIPAELLINFIHFRAVKIDDDDCFLELIYKIRRIQPALVIFDSLIRLHKAKENDAGEMARIMDRFRKIVNLGYGILILHHHTKGKGNLEIRARGSSDIIGACDVEYSLVKNENCLELYAVKSRRASIEPLSLQIETRAEGAVINYLGAVETKTSRKGKREEFILNILKEPQTIRELLEQLDEEEMSISEKPLRTILKKLIETNKLKEATGAHV